MATGTKTGGRVKGTPNRVTAEREAKIAAAGLTPLDYMLTILRDEAKPEAERFEAAKAAAPYCHAKLANSVIDLGSNTIDRLAEIIAGRRAKVAAMNEAQDG